MKKLTAGIFATILGLTAVDAFAADPVTIKQVASTAYVQGAIESLDSSVAASSGNALTGVTVVDGKITGKTEVEIPSAADVTDLKTRVTTAEGDIDDLQEASATHATKTELETAQNTLQGNINTVAGEVDALETGKQNLLGTTNVVSSGEGNVVSSVTAENGTVTVTKTSVATTGAVNTLSTDLTNLTTRVSTAEGEIDVIQADYLKAADIANLATKSEVTNATADMATQTWVGEQKYIDESELAGKGYLTSTSLTGYATEAYADQAEADAISTAAADATSKANQAEADAIAAAATDATSKANQALADAKAYADQAKAGAISAAATDAAGLYVPLSAVVDTYPASN